MKYASTLTMALHGGISGFPLRVEATARRGIPVWTLTPKQTGFSPDRIRAALIHSEYPVPVCSVMIHISPADEPRAGSQIDLAVATCILQALSLLPEDAKLPPNTLILGELNLGGEVLPVKNLLGYLRSAREQGIKSAAIPASQLGEVSGLDGIDLIPMRTLRDLLGVNSSTRAGSIATDVRPASLLGIKLPNELIRALTICASGWHSILLVGPPGTGKSTIAREIGAFLPPPREQEALDILAIRTIEEPDAWKEKIVRPVRSPHHSATAVALAGGGSPITPGEITRAHNGVLILDELGEFARNALQSIREPLENGTVNIVRNRQSMKLPARFLLAATSNPCPCGMRLSAGFPCSCSANALRSYRTRITGPLLDRIHLEVGTHSLSGEVCNLDTEKVRRQVSSAHSIQAERYANESFRFNGEMPASAIDRYLEIDSRARKILTSSKLSERKKHAMLRIARTIADLDRSRKVKVAHVLEASSLASMDEIRVV